MKNLSLTLALLTILAATSVAHAELNMINCDSIRGTNHSLVLVVANQDLKQIRIQSNNGGRSQAILPSKLINQNINGITLYTLLGQTGFMKVDNQVLAGNGGYVELANDEFSCL